MILRLPICSWLVGVALLLGVRPAPAADSTGAGGTNGMKTLTEADAIALLTASLQQDYVKDRGQLELLFTQPWVASDVPDGPLTVKILELPTEGVTAAFIIRFQLCTPDGNTVGTWQESMQAHIWREVWVAHSDLQRGEAVGDADVARERRDVLGIHESLAEFTPGDTALELGQSVQSGAPLLARELKPRSVVHRGELADALLQNGALSIMLKVEVLEDGAPGQVIHVRNPDSKRDFTGKVADDRTILVSL
jgi:flagella basal body P-ring formation protein FlgA